MPRDQKRRAMVAMGRKVSCCFLIILGLITLLSIHNGRVKCYFYLKWLFTFVKKTPTLH
jgi:hypothetical protein